MSKLGGLFGGSGQPQSQPQGAGAVTPPASQPIVGQNMFRRGQGGIFPERGSQAQYDMVQALLASALQQAPQSGSPLVAFLAPLITGAVGSRTQGLYDKRLTDEEQAKKDKAAAEKQSAIDALMGAMGAPMGGGGGGSALPGQPNAVRNAAMQRFGGPTKAAAEAVTGGDWLRYANDGAIRNKPISDKLQGSLSFLGDMGVTMEVFSGGQDAHGRGDRRTGSTRHDDGNSADVFFYKDGRKLDWANPQDRPVFQEIVSRAAKNGVTGFGAGEGYMQPGSMHIGFGSPAVWGAGGKGANAPDWLRQSYRSDPQSALDFANSLPTPAAPQRRTYSPEQQRQLMGIIGNENVPSGFRAMATQMLTESMKPPAAGPSLDDRIDTAQNLFDLQKSMTPNNENRKYATAPDGIPRYVDTGEPVYPGIQPKDNQNDAGILRQKNEAASAVQDQLDSLTGITGGEMSVEEARAQVARDPLYAGHLRLLGINPEDWTKAAEIARAKREAEKAAEEAAEGGGLFDSLFGGGKPELPGGPTQPAAPQVPDNDPLGIRQ